MTQHLRPDVRKHYISGSSCTADQDEEGEINEEYDECEDSDEGAAVAVGEVVYQDGGDASPHDDRMPCGSEVSVCTVNASR